MAQKRPSTVDQQPSASSSEHDHEEASSSSEEDEEDDEPAPPPAPAPAASKKPPSKKPPPPPAKSQPPPSPSDSATESESGFDSESDNDDPPAAAANPKAKPAATKPFEESPKPKKPRPQPSATPTRSASKRPGENNMHVNNESKRAKKKASDSSAAAAAAVEEDEVPATEEGGKKLGNDSKKLFQRIWSEEDEIAILKGLAEFSSKTGVDPYKDANAFHDFIKKSLRAEASSNQLKEKIRRLKKKFENNSGKGKNGEGPKFTKPHEQKAFELSKKVWANGGVEQAKADAKARKSQKEGGSRNVASVNPKAELVPQDSKEAGQKGVDENANDSTPHLSEMIRFDSILGVSGLNEDVLKRGVRLIGASKRAELEERWKNLQVAELELYVNRAELIKDQAKLIWEAYKSSNH